jgi:D-alanyl-D-alanine carboxypeptidase/D-alanyl-D-alanine-endopeptidase (penicillin-binding protein 4)
MGMSSLLYFMKKQGKYFNEFFASLPDAGKEGTLKNYFKDPLFESGLKAKSGSMTRVRSYAGYIKTSSGKDLIFCIIVNNYSGSSKNIIAHIEEILKETIQSN